MSAAPPFTCTTCGACCHDHNLPLTLAEAERWLADGGQVIVLCEATLWNTEPAPDDAQARHRRRRSFAARCGEAGIRITAILAAVNTGACRNLGPDQLCGIYERRPLVCRIYPAEINPFRAMDPSQKACPPEAWLAGKVLMSGLRILDAQVHEWVLQSRQADEDDAARKRVLCELLGIDVAGLVGEAIAIHQPEAGVLLQAMKASGETGRAGRDDDHVPRWRLRPANAASADRLAAERMVLVAVDAQDATHSLAALSAIR